MARLNGVAAGSSGKPIHNFDHRVEDKLPIIEGSMFEKIKYLDCWIVPKGCGFVDAPAGSNLYYVADGKVTHEGLCIIRENKPGGRMYVRKLCHEVINIRLTKTKHGKVYGEEIIIEVEDFKPKYICCGMVRVQCSPV